MNDSATRASVPWRCFMTCAENKQCPQSWFTTKQQLTMTRKSGKTARDNVKTVPTDPPAVMRVFNLILPATDHVSQTVMCSPCGNKYLPLCTGGLLGCVVMYRPSGGLQSRSVVHWLCQTHGCSVRAKMRMCLCLKQRFKAFPPSLSLSSCR